MESKTQTGRKTATEMMLETAGLPRTRANYLRMATFEGLTEPVDAEIEATFPAWVQAQRPPAPSAPAATPSGSYVEQMMERYPGISREEAQAMLDIHGF